ncbi:hypothetical protein E4T56_gene7043, partial [Termitomyces sp. T112]
ASVPIGRIAETGAQRLDQAAQLCRRLAPLSMGHVEKIGPCNEGGQHGQTQPGNGRIAHHVAIVDAQRQARADRDRPLGRVETPIPRAAIGIVEPPVAGQILQPAGRAMLGQLGWRGGAQ